MYPADSNLWIATERLIKPNTNEILLLKSENVYQNTEADKYELFAHTLENVFIFNSLLDNYKLYSSTKTK
jgi:hypothetical protein